MTARCELLLLLPFPLMVSFVLPLQSSFLLDRAFTRHASIFMTDETKSVPNMSFSFILAHGVYCNDIYIHVPFRSGACYYSVSILNVVKVVGSFIPFFQFCWVGQGNLFVFLRGKDLSELVGSASPFYACFSDKLFESFGVFDQ